MGKIKELFKKINKNRKRFVVINQLGWYFDSSKAEFIVKYRRYHRDHEMYITDNGIWVEVKERSSVEQISKNEVKRILKEINKVEIYEKYFEKLEEI